MLSIRQLNASLVHARMAGNADEAYAYLTATNAGTTHDDVLRVFANDLREPIPRLYETGELSSPNSRSARKW